MNLNKFIPGLKDRFVLNVLGDVVDVLTVSTVSFIRDGVKLVKLDWYNGAKEYEVGLVTVVASWGLSLPPKLWDRVTVRYSDGDPTNTKPCNVSYVFDNIEVEGMSGFYYIPGFSRYAINLDGTLVNVESGHVKSWYVVKPTPSKGIRGGYRITQAYTDRNHRTNISRHRAKALTFIPCPGDPNDFLVNHLNGIGGSDDLSNLEWTTSSGNQQHAYDSGLFDKKLRAILVKNSNTGEIIRYKSLTECSKKMDIVEATLRNRLKNNPGKGYSDGFAYKDDNDSPWVDGIVRERITYDVIFKNIFTDESFIVNNQREASKLSGVPDKSIWYHLSKDSETPINGFIFRRFEDDIEWPTFNQEQMEKFVKEYSAATIGPLG